MKGVHSDIRGFNLVFSDEGSLPIDFDFGGCKAKFPPGYQELLHDGNCFGCNVGKEITPKHDFEALQYVLTMLHGFGSHQLVLHVYELEREICHLESMEELLSKLQELQSICPCLKMVTINNYAACLGRQTGSKFPQEEAGPATTPQPAFKMTPSAAQHTLFGKKVENVSPSLTLEELCSQRESPGCCSPRHAKRQKN